MSGWHLDRIAGDSPSTFNVDISRIGFYLQDNRYATMIPCELWLIFVRLGRDILDFAHLLYDRADLQRFVGVAGEVAKLGVSELVGLERGTESKKQEKMKAYYLKGVEIELLWEKTVEKLVKLSGPRYREMMV